MKINRRASRQSAFTIIEVLTVIAIIAILATVIVGGMTLAMEKQNFSKAEVEIGLLSKALEEYKLDNGAYPPTPDSPDGENTSRLLFRALYWDSDNDQQGIGTGQEEGDRDQKIYVPELDPVTSKQKWTKPPASENTVITDPWKREYRYRSGKDQSGRTNPSTDNPDFDLWSTGKDGATKPATPTDKVNLDDVKSK